MKLPFTLPPSAKLFSSAFNEWKADKVPTLTQLLKLVDGRVPVVIELKGRKGDDEGFADSVLELIEDYKGPIALMSFDVVRLELVVPLVIGEQGHFDDLAAGIGREVLAERVARAGRRRRRSRLLAAVG